MAPTPAPPAAGRPRRPARPAGPARRKRPAGPLWRPTRQHVANARITAFQRFVERTYGRSFADYEALWRWSVDDPVQFWQAVWHFFEVRARSDGTGVLAGSRMPGARWYPQTTLNLVDHVFAQAAAMRPAIVAGNEAGARREIGWAELRAEVETMAAALRAHGVGPYDRVVAWLPNVPETVIAFLACAHVGAIWSVCSPDMGPLAVLDRFRQIEPRVLIACDGYRHGGKVHDRADTLLQIRNALPTLRHGVLLPLLADPAGIGIDAAHDRSRLPGFIGWRDFRGAGLAALGDTPSPPPTALPFSHPLWVVYSSGTTGIPKAIVHGHGGVLLETLKGNGLHNDLGPADRFFWHASTGWIMWNVQVGGLLLGSTACLYDGSPAWPDHGALWRFAADARVTFFGAGAAFHAGCMKAQVVPRSLADLSALRAVGSTGSPLPPEAYAWLQADVKPGVWIDVVSGGTDFCGAFLAGNVTLPLYAGEMQCRSLGAKVEAWNEQGQPVIDEVGELVCTAPLPSMPLYLWNDPDGTRYLESYFEMWPGVWRHGDWLRLVPRPGAVGGIIYGRSDATINRHGIRMGTAELYRAVEALPEVLDALVVDLEYLGRPSYMPLFVVLRPGVVLDDALRERIRAAVRAALSPRHVPDEIIAVGEVPRTLSGKKMELPVRKLLLGEAPEKVAHRDAMANPGSLETYVAFARKRAAVEGG